MKKLLWYLPFAGMYFVPKAINRGEVDNFNYVATAIMQGIYASVPLVLLIIACL